MVKKIKKEALTLGKIIRKKKLMYISVFCIPIIGATATGAWIALDYIKQKRGKNQ